MNCVSLGWYCATASALNGVGLREYSGPFDWYFTNDFRLIVQLIQTRFKDFLNKDNIVPNKENIHQFEDTKYNMYFFHENKNDLPFDYAFVEMKQKYDRRIERFLNRLKSPSYVFRIVTGNDEIDYINENYEYISNVFKEFNPLNEVIYILFNDFKELDEHCKQFRLSIPYSERPIEKEDMEKLFNTSEELIEFCRRIK